MRRWIELAASVYPRGWRDEYGEEFSALLDDVSPGWRVFANVLRGAIAMQIDKGVRWTTIVAGTAVAGAVLALAASFAAPQRYVSSAVLQISPMADPERPAPNRYLQERAADRLLQIHNEILSRTSLAELIQKRSLDLYRAERQRVPLEDVVQGMRRDIQIKSVPAGPARDGLVPMAFRLSFAYPDQVKAQAVVRELATKFTETNVMVQRNRASLYRAFWSDQAKSRPTPPVPPPPVGERLEVLEPPRLPQTSSGPNRLAFVAAGLGAGLLLGIVAALSLRRPRTVGLLGGCAVAGCAVAFAASFLLPERYVSTAVMRVTPAQVTEDPRATPELPALSGRLERLTPEILSPTRLAEMIQKPSLNLYQRARAQKPPEDVLRQMRNDIQVAPLRADTAPGVASAFRLSFAYTDRYKAQAVVRELITLFTEINVTQERALAATASPTQRAIAEHRGGENLEVLDPASLPESPITPNRMAIAALGLGGGLALGGLALWLRRRPEAPQAVAAGA
jgi:uncharacterized protein involved in exopolysaccharide biosynthesis